MYTIKPTTRFQKDLKRVQKRGYNLALLSDIIRKLQRGEALPQKNHDHDLGGDYEGFRELLFLTRTGSHSDLF